MTNEEKEVIDILENLGIEYKRIEPPPVFTVAEAKKYVKLKELVAKIYF